MSIDWKPKAWIAIVLGIALQPFTFLYLNRPKLFWLYLVLIFLVSIIDWRYGSQSALIFSFVCPLHAYLVVRKFVLVNERAWYSKWWGIPAIHLFLFSAALIVRSFFYEPFVFPSASMQPTIDAGDLLIVRKYGYGTYRTYGITLLNKGVSSPSLMRKGNLYAFYPPHQDVPFVKRLIASSGDTVTVRDNRVIVSGYSLPRILLSEQDELDVYEEESESRTYNIQQMESRPPSNTSEVTVPEGSYFFLGDNRDYSSDSRFWGSVTNENIIGEVVYVFK